MEIKIENQFCVKRFKPGHSRVARCHKPISILCQDFQSKFLNKIIQIIYQVTNNIANLRCRCPG